MRCKLTRGPGGNYWEVDVEGEPGTVLFCGDYGERKAREYARWKEGVTAGTALALSGYDRETLCRWWCDLNAFRWPEDFPEPEPPGWAGMAEWARYDSAGFCRAWRAVNAAVPLAEALAYWRGPYRYGLGRDEWAMTCDPPQSGPESWHDRPPLL
jgi:hypothetical protein